MVLSHRWAGAVQKQSFSAHVDEAVPIIVNHYMNCRPNVWLVDTQTREIGYYDYMMDDDAVDVEVAEAATASFAVRYVNLNTFYVYTDLLDGEIRWTH